MSISCQGTAHEGIAIDYYVPGNMRAPRWRDRTAQIPYQSHAQSSVRRVSALVKVQRWSPFPPFLQLALSMFCSFIPLFAYSTNLRNVCSRDRSGTRILPGFVRKYGFTKATFIRWAGPQ
ncbi:hypothetical protein L209DRAFT_759853 [Thermothelomyces heterothallicus CBS 203.75]